MSNSSLATLKKISPNSTNPRNHKIDKITVHHTAGVVNADVIGNIFAPKSRQGSCNYGIGADGKVILIVDEKNRSWCSSNAENDHRAITIEVSNSKNGGNWPVSDKVMDVLIDLCVDICKRNDIKELKFTGDKSGNLTLHKYFAATACPGPYLESKMPWIAEQVNKKLNPPKVETKKTFKVGDEVKLAANATYVSGVRVPTWVINSKLYVRELQDGGKIVFSTQKTGAITGVAYEKYFSKYGAAAKPATVTFKVKDKVKLVSGATYTNGKAIPKWLFGKTLYVREVHGNNIVFSWLSIGAITGTVNKKYLTKI